MRMEGHEVMDTLKVAISYITCLLIVAAIGSLWSCTQEKCLLVGVGPDGTVSPYTGQCIDFGRNEKDETLGSDGNSLGR